MQLGIVGLGRMGGNIARRLMREGHHTVVHDRNAPAIDTLVAEGATGAADLAALGNGAIEVTTVTTDNLAAAALAADKMAELIGGAGKVALVVHDQNNATRGGIAHTTVPGVFTEGVVDPVPADVNAAPSCVTSPLTEACGQRVR